MSNDTAVSRGKQDAAPRLLRREKNMIVENRLRWQRGDSWFWIGGPEGWTIDFQNGRAIIDLTRGENLSIEEITAQPERLIKKWEARA